MRVIKINIDQSFGLDAPNKEGTMEKGRSVVLILIIVVMVIVVSVATLPKEKASQSSMEMIHFDGRLPVYVGLALVAAVWCLYKLSKRRW